MRKIVCVLLTLLVSVSCLIVNVSGDTVKTENLIESKLSNELQEAKSLLEDDEKIDVAVWLKDAAENVYHNTYIKSIKESVKANKITTDVNIAKSIMENDIDVDVKDITLGEMQSILSVKRSASTEIITSINQNWINSFINRVGIQAEIIYISQYAPTVILRVTKDELSQLELSNDVERIYLWDENITLCNDDTAQLSLTSNSNDYGVWQNIANIYTMRNVMGYTGRNINIGLVEGAVPPEGYSTLDRDNIIRINEGSPHWHHIGHATMMAEIISGVSDDYTGVAPDANLYCVGLEEGGTVINSIEILLNRPTNINIINLSVLLDEFDESNANLYDYHSQYLDYIIYRHNVTVCTAAGNYGANGVMDGQMSYDSIVVGNIDDCDTLTLDDDVIHSSSSVATGVNIAYKPDLCAPGDKVRTPLTASVTGGGGTSSASAVVSGACALLMEANPVLIYKPMLMKSILMSSANRVANLESTYSTATSAFPAMLRAYGAGMINVTKANEIISDSDNWKYLNYQELMAGSVDYTMDIPVSQNAVNRNKNLAISLSWSAYARENTSSTLSSVQHYLELYDPNGECVARSRLWCDKKQYIYYLPTVAGTYQAKIVKVDDDGTGVVLTALSYALLS